MKQTVISSLIIYFSLFFLVQPRFAYNFECSETQRLWCSALIVQGKMLDSLWANLLGRGLRVLFVNRNCQTFWLTCFIFQSNSIHINFAESLDLRPSRSADWSWESFYLTSWCFHSSSNRSLPEFCRLSKNSSKAKRANCPSWTRPKTPNGWVVMLSEAWDTTRGSHRIFATWSIFNDKLKFVKYGRHVRLVISELSFKVRMVSWSPWWRDLTWRSSENFLMLPRTSRSSYCWFESSKNGSMIEKLWWSLLPISHACCVLDTSWISCPWYCVQLNIAVHCKLAEQGCEILQHVTSATAKIEETFLKCHIDFVFIQIISWFLAVLYIPGGATSDFSHQDANRQLLVGAAVEPKLPELDRVQSLVQADGEG